MFMLKRGFQQPRILRTSYAGICNRMMMMTTTTTTTTTTRIGFETSPLMNIDTESSLLEKSIRLGCKTVFIRSGIGTNSDYIQNYELLSDLASTDEINIDDFLLGHSFSMNSDAKNGESSSMNDSVNKHDLGMFWVKEMNRIGKTLRKKSIDFITISLPDISYIIHEESKKEFIVQLKILCGFLNDNESNTRIGIDFSTDLLVNASNEDISNILSAIEYISDELNNSITRKDGGNSIDCFSIASNCFTQSQAKQIRKWVDERYSRQNEIHEFDSPLVIATSVLNTHYKRPALLVPPIKLKAINDTSSSIKEREDGNNINLIMKEAVEDFQRSMDRCMHLEKQYMEKLQADIGTDIVLTDLCWGHVLMQAQGRINSSEEWEYLLSSQIEPKLEKSLEALRSKNKSCSEWSTLYSGMSRYLFATLSHFHQVRKLEQCDDLVHALKNNTQNDDTLLMTLHLLDCELNLLNARQHVDRASQLSCYIGSLSSVVTKPDSIVVAGMEISDDMWNIVNKHIQQNMNEIDINSSLKSIINPIFEKYNSNVE